MQTNSISVQVSPEVALAYVTAPEHEKAMAAELLKLLFTPEGRTSPSFLRLAADAANREAVANGLTEEILSAVLVAGSPSR